MDHRREDRIRETYARLTAALEDAAESASEGQAKLEDDDGYRDLADQLWRRLIVCIGILGEIDLHLAGARDGGS